MRTRTPGFPARVLSVALVAGLQFLTLPAHAELPAGSVSGQIFSGATDRPLGGATVHLADARSGDLLASAPTNDAGKFRIGNVRPAVYSLAIETGNGVFLSPTPVTVDPATNSLVRVAVYHQEEPTPPGEDDDDDDEGGLGFWNNPLAATLVVLGIAVVVGVVVDKATESDGPPTGSPSGP